MISLLKTTLCFSFFSCLLSISAVAQTLKLNVENVITISESDKPIGPGKYKEFYIDIQQGDRLEFDIKGKGGVDVPTLIELYPTNSYRTEYRTQRPENHQIWTSQALPACKLKVRIIAFIPYGALSIFVKKTNPGDDSGSDPHAANTKKQPSLGTKTVESIDLENRSKKELLELHDQLLSELQRIATELAKR